MTELPGAGVVVTGAGNGIGRALALRFAAEGARVVVNDIDSAACHSVTAEIMASGGVAAAVAGDAASPEGVAALINRARASLDSDIDIYFANAGIATECSEQTPDDDWERAWQINVMAHVRAARELTGPWLERGRGHFVSTVSAAGLLSMLGSASYSVTKHAAVSFAEWMAMTYGDRGITVQAICPLGVRTAMTDNKESATELLLKPTLIEPEAVADAVVQALRTGQFLILPHPEVAAMYAGRAAEPDRWLKGMRGLQAQVKKN